MSSPTASMTSRRHSVLSVNSNTASDNRFVELNDIIGTLQKGRYQTTLYACLPFVVFVLFLASSMIFGYYLSYKRELDDQEHLFETEFKGVADGVVRSVLHSFSLAKDVGFLLAYIFSVRELSCAEFAQVARAAVHTGSSETQAFLRAVSLNPIIKNEDRYFFEEKFRSSNDSRYNCTGGQSPNVDLGIWTTNVSNNEVPRPVPETDLYVPVLLIYPIESNKGAIGFDIHSLPIRRTTIEYSLQSGLAATTDIISLVQTNTSGCLFISPINNQTSNTITGFATLVVDFTIFTANITHGLVSDIDIVISSSLGSSTSYHITDNESKPIETSGDVYDKSFEPLAVSGQTTIGLTWTVSVYPTQKTKNHFITANLSTSMGLSLLLFAPTIVVFLVYAVFLCSFKIDIQQKVRAYTRTTVVDFGAINLTAGDVGLPVDQELEKPRELKRSAIKLLENIGNGAFGGVWKAFYDSRKDGLHFPPSLIAVKTCKIPEQSNALLKEAITMAQVDAHDNVVTLVGVVTKELPFMMCQIYCEFGGLNDYLIKKAREADSGKRPLSLETRLNMLNDTAKGMAHIISKKFVHRDLAARNVLVDSALVCRVADFGLTRFLDQVEADETKDYYRCSGKGVYPLRWTAPEAMTSGCFTEANDVWSWGVVAWEVFTDAQKPYPNVSNKDVFDFVHSGNVLDQPESCPQIFYNLQLECWNLNPLLRPTFADIVSHQAWNSYREYVDNNDNNNNNNNTSNNNNALINQISSTQERSGVVPQAYYEYSEFESSV